MGIWIKSKESIDIDYKMIRKKEYYEPRILQIMNDSQIVFPERYEHIEKQDNKEPDFISSSGLKYDAKLLFDSELCIALNQNRISDFMEDLMNYVGVDFPKQREVGPEGMKLYQEMKSRIESLEEDEIGILFLPFPILMNSPGSYFTDLCSDQFDWCFREMKMSKTVFLIGLNIEGLIVLKRLGGYGKTEFLKNRYFGNWIQTEIVDWGTEE